MANTEAFCGADSASHVRGSRSEATLGTSSARERNAIHSGNFPVASGLRATTPTRGAGFVLAFAIVGVEQPRCGKLTKRYG